LGVNVNFTKLITFTAAAAMAGLAGALFGGSPGLVTTNDFASLLSLVILLLARIGGITTATGALLGALVYALYPLLTQHVPQLGTAQYLLTGLGAISVGLFPYGMGGRIGQLADAWRAANARRQSGAPGSAVGTPAAVFIAEEGDQLVGAGS
jgi:branched-chain amino acid transport system permease protein